MQHILLTIVSPIVVTMQVISDSVPHARVNIEILPEKIKVSVRISKIVSAMYCT